MTFPAHTPLPHQPPAASTPTPQAPPRAQSRITWQVVVAVLGLLAGFGLAAALYDSSDPWRSCASEKAAAEAARAATPSMPSIANKDTAVEDKYLRAAAARDAATATYNECVNQAKSGRVIMLIPGIGIALAGTAPLLWMHFGAGIQDAAVRRRAETEAAQWAAANPPQPAPAPPQFAGYQGQASPIYAQQAHQAPSQYPVTEPVANPVQTQPEFSSPASQQDSAVDLDDLLDGKLR